MGVLKVPRRIRGIIVVGCLLLSLFVADTWGESPDAGLGIRGTMNISFGSRLQEAGVDTYSIDLLCADALRFKGKIIRQPGEISSFLGREKRAQELNYYLGLFVINPANRAEEKRAGQLSGIMRVRTDGRYDLSSLKIEGTLPAFAKPLSGEFAGVIQGRASEKKGLIGATYSRIFNGRKVTMSLAQVDPLAFRAVQLAPGPLGLYAEATVNGKMDFDYDTGNWISPGISFVSPDGKKDVITGSIKWTPDENRQANGLSRYDFNLRYNETAFAPPADESAAFAAVADESAFFAVDERIPTIKGTITYRDTFAGVNTEDGEPVVTASAINYELDGAKVTKQQLIQFLKWWLLIVGPVNDE